MRVSGLSIALLSILFAALISGVGATLAWLARKYLGNIESRLDSLDQSITKQWVAHERRLTRIESFLDIVTLSSGQRRRWTDSAAYVREVLDDNDDGE